MGIDTIFLISLIENIFFGLFGVSVGILFVSLVNYADNNNWLIGFKIRMILLITLIFSIVMIITIPPKKEMFMYWADHKTLTELKERCQALNYSENICTIFKKSEPIEEKVNNEKI